MVSVINAMEAYAYANLLSQGLAGSSPWEFVTGGSDIGYTQMSGSTAMTLTGADKLSLTELVTAPDVAFDAMQKNFAANYQAMAIQAATIGISFRLGKKLLRRPISSVNRNIMKPLGIGIKL
tara:strand:- start:3795 stop:4160 length:366 start_codon:yes stop_codon:yes gene_type:complete